MLYVAICALDLRSAICRFRGRDRSDGAEWRPVVRGGDCSLLGKDSPRCSPTVVVGGRRLCPTTGQEQDVGAAGVGKTEGSVWDGSRPRGTPSRVSPRVSGATGASGACRLRPDGNPTYRRSRLDRSPSVPLFRLVPGVCTEWVDRSSREFRLSFRGSGKTAAA